MGRGSGISCCRLSLLLQLLYLLPQISGWGIRMPDIFTANILYNASALMSVSVCYLGVGLACN